MRLLRQPIRMSYSSVYPCSLSYAVAIRTAQCIRVAYLAHPMSYSSVYPCSLSYAVAHPHVLQLSVSV